MKRWQFWLGIAVGLVCVLWVASTIDNPRSFKDALLAAKWIYLIPIIGAYFVIMLLRTWRWRYILNHCGEVQYKNVLVSLLVCYMGNNIFPLRAGELMRVFLIGKQEESISYSAALATVVVERLFDFLIMLLSLAVVLMLIPFPESGLVVAIGDQQYDLVALIRGLGVGTLAGATVLFAFLILLNARTELAMRIVDAILGFGVKVLDKAGDKVSALGKVLDDRPARLQQTVQGVLERFASGLSIMGRPRALFALTAMSMMIWFVNLSPVWLSAMAFDEIGPIDPTGLLFLLVVGGAAASIPGPPGFFGIFHAFTQFGLVFYLGLSDIAVSDETALSFAIIVHGCYYFPTIVAGAVAAWAQGYSLTRLREEAADRERESGPDDLA